MISSMGALLTRFDEIDKTFRARHNARLALEDRAHSAERLASFGMIVAFMAGLPFIWSGLTPQIAVLYAGAISALYWLVGLFIHVKFVKRPLEQLEKDYPLPPLRQRGAGGLV